METSKEISIVNILVGGKPIGPEIYDIKFSGSYSEEYGIWDIESVLLPTESGHHECFGDAEFHWVVEAVEHYLKGTFPSDLPYAPIPSPFLQSEFI